MAMSAVTLRGQSRQPSSFNSVDNAIEVTSNPAFRHTVGRSFGAGVTSHRPTVHRSGHVHARHEVDPPARRTIPPYDGFQSPAAGPASGRVSPESHDAIATISA